MVRVVRREQDGEAVVHEVAEQGQHPRLVAQVEACGRLVRDEEPAPGGHCTGDQHELLLTAAERGKRPLLQRADANALDGRPCRCEVR